MYPRPLSSVSTWAALLHTSVEYWETVVRVGVFVQIYRCMIKKRKKYNRIVLCMWIGNDTENYYLLQLCTTTTMHRFLKSQKIALTYFMSRTWFIPSIWTTTLPTSIFRPFKNYCKIVNQSVKRVFKTVHNWVVLPRYT